MLIWSGFELEQLAAGVNCPRLEQSQEPLGDALPSAARTDIHAFEFAEFRVEDYCPTADCFARTIPRNGKQDIRLLQRRQVKDVPALRRIQGVLIRVQLGNEGNHVRLIGGFESDVHD
ncbi:hypothetical protein BGV72_25085 [Burkholderia ubonensis]|nr:hypothetical protein BGV72_25085 [Burkholderia ubonensis]